MVVTHMSVGYTHMYISLLAPWLYFQLELEKSRGELQTMDMEVAQLRAVSC